MIGLAVLGAIISPPKPNPAPAPSASDVQQSGEQDSTETQTNDPGISAAEFSQLRNGMSYEQAQEIVGSPGELVSDSEIAGIRTFAVKWDGESGLGANANVMFQNGQLVMKAQFGLR